MTLTLESVRNLHACLDEIEISAGRLHTVLADQKPLARLTEQILDSVSQAWLTIPRQPGE